MIGTGIQPYALAIAAAACFGASIPLSKLLLRDVGPVGLAGLLYLSSGLGLGALRLVLRGSREASLRRSDLGWLAGVVASGGVAGPILLLLGLSRTSAHVSALLANTETIFTIALAVVFFGDFLLRREAIGAMLILGGATLVTWAGATQGGRSDWQGPLLLLASALAWGLDNNFSQRISAKDPLQIAMIKGLVAGMVNLVLAAMTEGPPRPNAAAFGVGFACYGLSVVFFMVVLRHLGAARTSALFATAPAFAIALSWAILHEVPGIWTGLGGLLMIPGVWLLIRVEHSHRHAHDAMEHEHRHVFPKN